MPADDIVVLLWYFKI